MLNTLDARRDDDVVWAATNNPSIERILAAPGARFTSAATECLGRFHRLTHVALRGPSINDATVKHLERHGPTILVLDLSGTGITGQVATTIAKFANVTEIHVRGTRFDDAGLQLLTPLAKTLRCLDASATRVTTAGLAHLRVFQTMLELSLAQLDFSQGQGQNQIGQAIQHLSALKELVFLDLSYTGVNNICLAALAQLPALAELLISGNPKAAYDGLKQFRNSKTLVRLLCDGTGIKDSERQSFETALGRKLLF